jgi:DNA-directed RNA polymerase alpha subunit
MFISCKESRIENNRSFYGRFHLGTFEPGQSLTIANALRRSLLSDCVGVAIISLKIENVYHEYSTLPGVKDSILDIILNFKEIVLKKINNPLQGFQGYKNKGICSIYEQIGSTFFKPMIGYLKVQGPGIIRAKDLRLPPFLQCVDPNQYIATLADDGFLNVKFVVMEGKSYFIQKPTQFSHQDETPSRDKTNNLSSRHVDRRKNENRFLKKTFSGAGESYTGHQQQKMKTLGVKALDSSKTRRNNFLDSDNQSGVGVEQAGPYKQFNESSSYSALLNKRQHLLNHLTKILSNSMTKDQKSLNDNDHVNNEVFLRKNIKEEFSADTSVSNKRGVKENSGGTQLNIDAIFSPVTKVNYVIENTDNYLIDSYEERFKYIDNLSSFIDSSKFLGYEGNGIAFHSIKSKVFPHFNEKFIFCPQENRDWSSEKNVKSETPAFAEKPDHESTLKLTSTMDKTPAIEDRESFDIESRTVDRIGPDLPVLCDSDGHSHFKSVGIPHSSMIYSLSLNSNIDYIKQLFESNLHRTTRQIVLLEIWTNGSIHPRDALSMSFKNLSSVFSTQKLKMLDSIFNSSTSYKKTILKDH